MESLCFFLDKTLDVQRQIHNPILTKDKSMDKLYKLTF